MATSSVQICNDALLLLGADTITSLSSTGTKEQRIMNEQYEKVRDQLLIAHKWNFAIARIEIASDANLPTNWVDDIWTYSFTLGADVLRVLSIDDENEDWAVENGKLFCNYDPVKIKYIKKETDTTLFSKNFEKALAYQLAVRTGYAFTQSSTLMETLKEEAELVLREARSMDAQEGSVQTYEINDFLNQRRS